MRVWSRLRPAFSITGPILGKELRVASRRRRTYLVRGLYVAAMLLVVALVWAQEVSARWRWSVWSVARMAEAGKVIHVAVIWFQFIAAQLAAVILLSNAISEEVYARTLPALMSTPINSFQIVAGKLLSKLWQLLLLLALGVPLLAVVRVLGGVEWEFVISGFCVTLTAVIFVASLSLLFSIRNRNVLIAMAKTLFIVAVLYLGLPFLIGYYLDEVARLPVPVWIGPLMTFNPPGTLSYCTERMMSPRLLGGVTVSWIVHCGIMLAASAGVLALCVARVRKVALALAAGEEPGRRRKRRLKPTFAAAGAGRARRTRRVSDWPVVWKELRTFRPGRGMRWLYLGVIAVILIVYAIAAGENALTDDDFHVGFITILATLAMLVTAVVAASRVTAEKEARTWALLLGTVLSGRAILWSKAAGAVVRSLPVWLLLMVHLVVFMVGGVIHPIALLHMGMLAAWLTAFFVGVGLFFSVVLKRTVSAVLATLGLAVAIWVVLPACLGVVAIGSMDHGGEELLEVAAGAHPTIQAIVIADAACGRHVAQDYVEDLEWDWPGFETGAGQATAILAGSVVGYGLLGLVFLLAGSAVVRGRRS